VNSRDLIKNRRYLVLRELVGILGDTGKIKVQKLVYFFQEQYSLPLGYEFSMYHYGPYSEELDSDLTAMKIEGHLSIDPDPDGYGFHVRAQDEPELEWGSLSHGDRAAIKDIVDRFGSHHAPELELRATIHFVHRTTKGDRQSVVSSVKSLKPKFSRDAIESAYDEMTREHFISDAES